MSEGITDESANQAPDQRQPPELAVKVLEKRDLPSQSTSWTDLKNDYQPVDFLLLTVKECEKLSCLTFLKKGFVRSYIDTLGIAYFGKIGEEGVKVAVMQCDMGSSTTGGSLVVVLNAVRILRPKAVIVVGFCGSLNEKKAKLGDVVVSSKVITYAPVKRSADRIQWRNDKVPLNRDMANLVKSIGDGWKPPTKISTGGKVEVGVFMSGPEVVNNEERRNELIRQFPEAIAIEMEGEGMWAASHNLKIEWVVIKGVSDFANGKKSETDNWRTFASVMAASLVKHTLNDASVFKSWSHFKALVKDGGPSDEVLEKLSWELGGKWETLGRRLGFNQALIINFKEDNDTLQKRAYSMLREWKLKRGGDATYIVLYDALCHELVGRKLLAEQFCCEKMPLPSLLS